VKKTFCTSLIVLTFLITNSVPGTAVSNSRSSDAIPRSVNIEILLLKAPGLNVSGSSWEIAYEFRITNALSRWTERKKFKGASHERAGDLIKEGDVKKMLQARDNQNIVFQIPLGPEIQQRLKDQPRELVKVTSGSITPEQIRLSREQEEKSQVFLFYSVISIRDAKLRKTLTIPVNRIWDFVDYPEAKFQIRIEINNDGSYSVDSRDPKKPKDGIKIVK